MQNFNPPNQTEHHLFLIIKVLQFSQSVPKPFLDNIGLNLITLCFYLYPAVFAFLQLLSNAFRNGLPQRTHNHTCCLSLSFLHSVFLINDFLSQLPHRMHNHIGCICSAFSQCVFSCVSANTMPERIRGHIGCICAAFLHCVFSYVASSCLPQSIQNYTCCICLIFLHRVFSNVASNSLP